MSKNARRDETRGASARLGQKMTLEGGHEPERRNVSCASGCVGCVGNSLKNWWEMRRCVWHWRGALRYASPRYSVWSTLYLYRRMGPWGNFFDDDECSMRVALTGRGKRWERRGQPCLVGWNEVWLVQRMGTNGA
ncbi:hypothetical protein CSPX01_13133 [Colletotrichum filicis]|nr:hypothetical protein CSPX01_13133 [Colletotrichum filicis]